MYAAASTAKLMKQSMAPNDVKDDGIHKQAESCDSGTSLLSDG